ncbi:ABC transporter ATP-binding protein [Niallia taxi]|uniref:ABC transporter ATP-binding protein n=1 Tax=Niallia taxi TaxID=2499688 RepID=UPI0023A9474D|nr:ABC transporter ATP-binding protein [Niallia taxi]MDE5052563.1 ABC transporter ATP-binding protein [Niallia taxi]MED3962930.1 ABC transporter ATP-binding protein [Niallia taxi]WOD65586.1 ABC transporter ATP-binding protein [Niallia taxi]
MKLEIKNVTKAYKQKIAVHNFSMEVQTGECLGLIGPNGAGKSTLINMVANIIESDTGQILLDGKRISSMRKEIGYLPQFPNFYNWMTATETLMFMGQLSGLKKEKLEREIPQLLTKVGLSKEGNTRVKTFSGGMKQRLGIAQSLLHKPAFIVMDEPVSALDPIGRREVLNIIQEIKKDTTILLSTHILQDAEEICERFVIIKEGQKIEDTTIVELLNRDSNNKINFEITAASLHWLNIIKELSYVKNVEVFGNKVKIEVEDIQSNKNMLLASALEHHVDIIRFAMENDSLEEIFLKLVV